MNKNVFILFQVLLAPAAFAEGLSLTEQQDIAKKVRAGCAPEKIS